MDYFNENSQVVMKSVQNKDQKKATDFGSVALMMNIGFTFSNHRIEVTQ